MNENNIDLKNKLIQYLNNEEVPQMVFAQSDVQKQIIEDISIIQSFYGTDFKRILATTKALRYIIEYNYMPQEWIFVEAQKSDEDCVFKWIANYGIKYKFVKITDEQDGLFLKTPLWNIGVLESTCSKLCFIDSDIAFCNSDWLNNVNCAFEKYDVMSLNGYAYYEVEGHKLLESIGYKYLTDTKCVSLGHMGFTFGCTREVFDKLNGFDCVCVNLDDFWNWARILGKSCFKSKSKWLMCELRKNEQYGLNIRLGSTEEICCHMFHGSIDERKYIDFINVVKNKVDDISELIVYNKQTPNILPIWNTQNNITLVIRDSILDIYNSDSNIIVDDLFNKNAKRIFGCIDNDHPLIICTEFIPRFNYGIQEFLEFKMNIDANISEKFEFVCFTNEDLSEYSIDCIPLSKEYQDIEDCKQELNRSDIDFPEHSTIEWIEYGTKLDNLVFWRKCK